MNNRTNREGKKSGAKKNRKKKIKFGIVMNNVKIVNTVINIRERK